MTALKRYRDFAPTGFDPKGLGLPDQQDWLVVPVGRSRDSDVLSESNFASALATLGGESDTVEIHRFGHWACGWFEVLLAHPSRAAAVEEIGNALASYPILSEEDFYERERAECDRAWADYEAKDTVRELTKRHGLSDRAAELLLAAEDSLRVALETRESAYCTDEGPRFPSPDHIERDTLAQILREARESRKESA